MWPIGTFNRFLMRMTMKSLRENPQDWVFSQHEAKNAKIGIAVWTGSGISALRIKTDEGYEFGGVTLYSTFFGYFSWRIFLSRALGTAQKHRFLMRHNLASYD